jgi:hypothetical protein
MTNLFIPAVSIIERGNQVINSQYKFASTKYGTQEMHNIEQTLITLSPLSGQNIPRNTLEAMLTNTFKGSDLKPSMMVSWFIKNEIIFVV